ncbi:MAG: hypothetical protein U0574_04500 [Phycisphaerales bacterium]
MKGISFFEQHVEKIVVGVAALGLVTVAGMELLSGRSVKSGSVELTPSNVNEVLDARAKAIEGGLSDGSARIKLDDKPLPLVAAEFTERLAKPLASAAPLPRIAPSLAGSLMDSDVLTDTWYYEPKLAAVRMGPDVMQTSDAIPASVLTDKEHEGLAAYFPDAGSAAAVDVTWLTPWATLDLKALKAELRRADQDAKPPRAAVPTAWFNEGTYIVDVLFEREELQPGGAWGKRTVVKPLPGHLTYRPRLGAADLTLRDQVMRQLASPARQLEILQPAFYDTRNDSFIQPGSAPEAGAANLAEAREIMKIRRAAGRRGPRHREDRREAQGGGGRSSRMTSARRTRIRTRVAQVRPPVVVADSAARAARQAAPVAPAAPEAAEAPAATASAAGVAGTCRLRVEVAWEAAVVAASWDRPPALAPGPVTTARRNSACGSPAS